MSLKQYEFWFITGSQHLYGPDTLKQVAEHSKVIADTLNQSSAIPCSVIFKPIVKTPDEITALVKEANYADNCLGIITWMHTFSPSKMWINGLTRLEKPYLHLHTQFNRTIPNEGIDMDFMNLNQSAHGDREHGFIGTRLRMARKVIAGYWEDEDVQERIGSWMRSAVGVAVSKGLKVIRFGDNMRQVAVTEGDKVEAQIKLGWQVNTTAVGDLVAEINNVTEAQIDAVMKEYEEKYEFNTDNIASVRYQAKVEVALMKMITEGGYGAFTNTFEDLHGMEQLPGLASQRVMEAGYGYGGEGDWKVSALTHILKRMAEGLPGGTAFMEDYTYDLTKGNELSLGAHMLEVCPTLAAGKPKIEVHPLGIGGKADPARLVFEGHEGKAIVVSLVDMGGRLRLIVQDVVAVKPIYDMPNLPVARVMWKAMPDLKTGAECWILAGGAHHTVFSYSITAEQMQDWAEMMDIEYVHISESTTVENLKQQLFLQDIAWKLK
ncbi:L-arabinose isomerase [Anaerocolumna sp. AGMB13020]|uniref:L-arabinose isomerase n=1 Tax=Anaerocolumna sp. AGMB13020 TaxID=3081750 RepID=UPI0029529DDE|nr:L-arabinose isomerase [Anaerocolumna sp. AGMB13020]WOO34590.1 L-arabinose isomerase [Anaerocolumna sp. AGMB13020]